MSQLSTILKRLMLKENLTESELSRRTGIGQPVIHRISSGETDNPKIDTLLPIAGYFSITLSELVGDHPLPAGKIHSNNSTPVAVHWQKVPLLNWGQVDHWLNHKQCQFPLRNIGCQYALSEQAYAVEMSDNSLSPRFPVNTVFVVEPERAPVQGSFCVVLPSGHQTAVVYQMKIDSEGNASYQPLNQHYQGLAGAEAKQAKCLGVAVQAVFE